METRKKVYWERQEVVEYWTYSDLHGYREVSKDIGMTWKSDSYQFHTQIANDETFENRTEGCIKW